MRNKVLAIILSLFSAFYMGTAMASPFPNPAPTLLADDIVGSGLFSLTDSSSIAVETGDLGSTIDSSLGATFGFYYASDSSTLIEIFDSADQDPNAIAVIDFTSGIVLDYDQTEATSTPVIQSSFTVMSGPIGFYIDIADAVATALSLPISTFYSDPTLNYGIDVYGAFPFLSDPTSMLLSASIANGLGGFIELGSYVVTNVNPVSEPPLFLLMLAGLVGLAASRQQLAKNK